MIYLAWAVLAFGMLAGIAIILFGLAGTFVIVGAAAAFAFLTHFHSITWLFLGILLGISLIAEGIEFFMGAAYARRHGSSHWGMAGAILGGLVGAGALTPVFPILGTVFGAFAGAFAGAFLFELLHFENAGRALRAGWGAFLGAVTGRIMKLVIAVIMIGMILFRILR